MPSTWEHRSDIWWVVQPPGGAFPRNPAHFPNHDKTLRTSKGRNKNGNIFMKKKRSYEIQYFSTKENISRVFYAESCYGERNTGTWKSFGKRILLHLSTYHGRNPICLRRPTGLPYSRYSSFYYSRGAISFTGGAVEEDVHVCVWESWNIEDYEVEFFFGASVRRRPANRGGEIPSADIIRLES